MIKYLKDPMSGLTHSIGAILSIIALVLLILKAVNPVDPWKIVSFSIFGTGLFLLYTASTLYHWIPVSGRAESILKRFDHIMIYVLIASTYTNSIAGALGLESVWCCLGFSCLWYPLEIIPIQIFELVFHCLLCVYGLVMYYCYLATIYTLANGCVNMVIYRWNILFRWCRFLCIGSAKITA